MDQTLPYPVIIEPDEDGFFVAHCPALPGCVSQGQSQEEARANIAEAMACYLECMADCGETPPACPGPPEAK